MRCIKCNYLLDGLNQNICPECGTAFNPNRDEFTQTSSRLGRAFQSRESRIFPLQIAGLCIVISAGHGVGVLGMALIFGFSGILDGGLSIKKMTLICSGISQIVLPLSHLVSRAEVRLSIIVFAAIATIAECVAILKIEPTGWRLMLCSGLPFLFLLCASVFYELRILVQKRRDAAETR